MTFFTKVTAPSKATFETVEKEYVVWCTGLSGTMLGKKHSAETRALMSATRSGVLSPTYGKKHSAETRAKIGAANKGRTISAESRAKLSAALKGKPKPKWSAESRANFSASKSKPVMTPYGLFPSIRAIAEASGRDASTVRTWLRKFPEHYYYVKKGE